MNLDIATQWIASLGKNFEIHSMQRLSGGANNQVFRLNDHFILKKYFQHPEDPRKRQETEFAFLTYSWKIGLRQIPEPLASNEKTGVALYSAVPGKLANREDLSPSLFQQSLDFFLLLNRQKHLGLHLGAASEPSFRLIDAIHFIDRRMARLKANALINNLLKEKLCPLWETLKCKAALHDLTSFLPATSLCLSPADFGLHNILIDQGKAYFIDFEYAGWDDPAKAIGDFAASPHTIMPGNYCIQFAEAVAQTFADRESFYRRLKIHFLLSQIKWSCIILNVFLKTDWERRQFSHSDQTLQMQLQKANQYIESITLEIPYGLR